MGLPRDSWSVWVLDFVLGRFHNMSPGGYEGTFIKAGDSEKRKGLAWRKQQENLGWATRAHWEVRAEGLGDRFRGSAWDELPAAPCLEFRRRVPVGKEVGAEEGKGNGAGCSQRESVCTGSFVLRTLCLGPFYLPLAGGNLRGGLRGGFHHFSRCALSGHGLQ